MDVDALSEPMRRGLARAAADGPQIMKWKVKHRGTPYPTRWNNLRPGTYGVDYFDRAAGALEGLFVHDRDEAEYFSTYEDGDAALLDGAQRLSCCTSAAEQIPPTTAERILVNHHVRLGLPARQEPDQPILHRRQNPGTGAKSRRFHSTSTSRINRRQATRATGYPRRPAGSSA